MQEKKIGELIAEAREKKGLSQRQLAKIAKISNAELSKIESGEREIPNPKTLRKISNIIDVNYNDMMYMIGLGIEVSPLNPFIKDYYEKMNLDQLAEAEVNVLGSISNSEQLVKSCKENLEKENILESEKELLQHTIEDTNYQIRTSREIVKLIQNLKLRERNKNEKKY
ncbi:MAG: helix-turn-helix transcriptional regulator [Bacilli bacterium]|jgi:transcriptional regulator with XRE-family HTH domain